MSISSNIEFLRSQLPSNVALCAVSKFNPVSAIEQAYGAGQRIFGESRPQELAIKAAQLPPDIKWHFIGHLQTNKVALILPFVTLIESVDSLKLLEVIGANAVKIGKTVDILLEVHIAAEDSKQGFSAQQVDGIMADGAPAGTKIVGLMGMATFTPDMEQVRSEFLTLAAIYNKYKSFNVLSMGMSADWQIAVQCGANMVRIGSSIFGDRI